MRLGRNYRQFLPKQGYITARCLALKKRCQATTVKDEEEGIRKGRTWGKQDGLNALPEARRSSYLSLGLHLICECFAKLREDASIYIEWRSRQTPGWSAAYGPWLWWLGLVKGSSWPRLRYIATCCSRSCEDKANVRTLNKAVEAQHRNPYT